MKKSIHDVQTGETIVIDMTAEEIAEIETKVANRAALVESEANAKAALLEKLGITADEAKLLLA
jgi:hypothetical protein